MNEAAEKEPTMEEILASIRRIISEDAPAADSSEGETSDSEVEKPQPPTAGETQEESEGADILELTERAEEEPTEAGDAPDESEEPAAETETVSDEAPEPEPAMESEPAPDTADPFPENEEDDRLVSEDTEHAASASFAELSAMLVGGYDGANHTLEGLVREMLKPMLKSWLDENLPRIVEDMVEREVARIAARRGRK